ncbi:proline-rich early nodulin [Colletotrichum karsti]|uniref:Proline-rich early nodulin n=1 Tax=Colletotrichum karsti TaxID=1095194 RepID=A0A9P6IE18_9PEZI|nr:proline-rich early nodulin [Colletotrichum karsti]KAF9881133.1 proline-rich early nodulin [Colletotrichum karsti]
MAVTPPSSVDIEMADAASATSGLTTPPEEHGSVYEDVVERKASPTNNQIASLQKINLESPITNTESPTMARRSSRNRNKPKPVVTSPTRPAKKKIVTRKPKWTAEKLLTDAKSPLANADLRTILCQPAAWDVLSPTDRAEIMTLFPDGTKILDEGTDNARPDFEALLNDDNFRHDCATYTDNIARGKHDPEWLEQAWAARDRRRIGDFDEYLAQKFEDEWSCKLPAASGENGTKGGEKVESPPKVMDNLEQPAPPRAIAEPNWDNEVEVAVAVEEPYSEGESEGEGGPDQTEAEIQDSQASNDANTDAKDESPSPDGPRVTLGSPVPGDSEDGSKGGQ